MSSGFYERVYEVVARVPRGKVVTYGQIALHLGMPQGARAVGWAMRQCPGSLPWHRVVNAQGELWASFDSRHSYGESKLAHSKGAHPEYCPLQRSLLEEEGVSFLADGRVDLGVFGWDEI